MTKKTPDAINRKRPTLKSIAERTGLAVTTVSKVLRGQGNFSNDTIKRIQQVAEEIGYRPDRSGVGLRTGRSYVISVAFNQSEDISDFERQIVSGVASALHETPYQLSLNVTFPGADEVAAYRNIAEFRRADGIIFADTFPDDARVKLLQNLDFPFVTHGRTKLSEPHAFYDFDNEKFAYLSALRLASNGRQRIAIASEDVGLTFYEYAMDGLRRAAQETGVSVSVLRPAPGVKTYAAAIHEGVRAAVAQNELPDGIISSSDIGTLAILDALAIEGIKVGTDVDVVSRKTSSILDFCQPRVDTISEDLAEAGEVMARLLVRRIEGEAPANLQIIGEPFPDWEQ
ncbi:transcription regulator aglr [Roseibium sp. TrichSKD4]|uniref:LacI family transcriptional regulator n=1 Tax=Roseibium sp. TrichSKD4 TaxID=744980 RepID=UPI0001E575B0|nr:LacI family transcriptional regulator [Roseibium sp. TrichSKD4]EFO29387.1 transcription regulator aglr [Roseibium sp. TrichSKD4]